MSASLSARPGIPASRELPGSFHADASNPEALLAVADREQIDFTVVGPELPLSFGVADTFAAAGRLLFGPSAAAARLESSKAFAKAFMARHAVPTARFHTSLSLDDAMRVVRSGEFGWPVVLKADGLAAGKGVVIAEDRAAAETAVLEAMAERKFGAAGEKLVIEECLSGPEVSFFVLSDGERAVPIGWAQDHKRIFDEDRGPNTGGMGAFAPSPLVDASLVERVMREIVEPVVAGMAEEGYPFRGFLFVGLMLTAGGPEGDRVQRSSGRSGNAGHAAAHRRAAAAASGRWCDGPAAAVCDPDRATTASSVSCLRRGATRIPQNPTRVISGIDAAERLPGVAVYHAGTSLRGGQLVTAGGRVLTVAGRGADFAEAISRAYAGVEQISFDGMQYRRDIGTKGAGPTSY